MTDWTDVANHGVLGDIRCERSVPIGGFMRTNISTGSAMTRVYVRLLAGAASLLLLGASVSGCGSSTNNGKSSGQTSTTTARTPTATATETPTPEPDADGDGTTDDVDYRPHNAKIQTKADAVDCDVLGINDVKLHEGACTQPNGQKVKVVNKTTTLVLPQMSVHYNGYTTASSISSDVGTEAANGTYVIVSLTITNRLDSPVAVEPDGIALGLVRHGHFKTYTHSFDAENEPGSSFVWNSDPIQPDQSQTGTVIFDIPTNYVSLVARNGNLIVYQFSDASNASFDEQPHKRVGVIRTYH